MHPNAVPLSFLKGVDPVAGVVGPQDGCGAAGGVGDGAVDGGGGVGGGGGETVAGAAVDPRRQSS